MHMVNVLTFPAHGSVIHESQCGKYTLPDYTDMYEYLHQQGDNLAFDIHKNLQSLHD